MENVTLRELVLSNELINVELHHRERFGELTFRSLGPHQRESYLLRYFFSELCICGLGFLYCFRGHSVKGREIF